MMMEKVTSRSIEYSLVLKNSNSKLFLSEIAFRQRNQRVWATIPKESSTKTLVTFPQIFLPRTMGNDPMH